MWSQPGTGEQHISPAQPTQQHALESFLSILDDPALATDTRNSVEQASRLLAKQLSKEGHGIEAVQIMTVKLKEWTAAVRGELQTVPHDLNEAEAAAREAFKKCYGTMLIVDNTLKRLNIRPPGNDPEPEYITSLRGYVLGAPCTLR
eukprot:TRINITY_DN24233_c0_g1_i1.p1 TRINITY_DN24233_c0_g1~~TRINITY_DN24233_c0_g1_i1.p1  ORF type:complete len:147 (-),score=31.80 TRINITY_DN24233_c0_g1_i1:2-442(-)